MQHLVGQGILKIRVGRGTFVADQAPVEEDFGFDQLKLTHLKLRDLYELRLMLEPQLTYYAALRATDEELDNILSLGENIKHVSNLRDEDLVGNRLFHNAIARASHNEFAIKLMDILHSALIRAFHETGVRQVMSADSLQDHQLIMDFLRTRDAGGAKLAMELHMKRAIQDYEI